MHRIRFGVRNAGEGIGMLWGALVTVLRWVVVGVLALIVVVAIESALVHFVSSSIVLDSKTAPLLTGFITVAVQVSASLLGFYLASVGIVLGTSYDNVSAEVRSLVLGNARTKWRLKTIGSAIGIGLALLLLQPLITISFGYITVLLYVVLVTLSGWAFIQLAFGAFHLFNPTELAKEPLRELHRVIIRLESSELLEDDKALTAIALMANRDLRILAELVNLIGSRKLVDRGALARTIQCLLNLVELFSEKKHLLAPTSGWFLTEPVYPKWVEADHSMMSIALKTSMHLEPKMEPIVDWFERRSAELVVAALRACVDANDQVSALTITRSVILTVQRLAQRLSFDDAIMIAEVVRDACWTDQGDKEAASAVAIEPPLLLANILLGWKHALNSWPKEVKAAVRNSEWHRVKVSAVSARGPKRVWDVAQRLHREVHAELAIEGHRVTPDWYLESTLAAECILSIREFADQLPILLKSFTCPTHSLSSSKVKVAVALQSLQTIRKAELVVEAIPQAVASLEQLIRGHDKQSCPELKNLLCRVSASEEPLLRRIANSVTELNPDQASSEPDLFGEALFRLNHHLEQEIATGESDNLQRRFQQVILASFKMYMYMKATYRPPTYRVHVANLNPVLDILELSGLAIIYEVLRSDDSAEQVRQAWKSWLEESGKAKALEILDILDVAEGSFPPVSDSSIVRFAWNRRLSDKIQKAGYWPSQYCPGVSLPSWNAPRFIKMLELNSSFSNSRIYPRTIFVARLIVQFAGEPEEKLRARPGLRHYYEESDILDKNDLEAANYQ